MFKKLFMVMVLSATMLLSTANGSSTCSAEATDCNKTAYATMPLYGSCTKKEMGYTAGVTTFDCTGAWTKTDSVKCPAPCI